MQPRNEPPLFRITKFLVRKVLEKRRDDDGRTDAQDG
jgi:hypothetical protein